MNKLFFVLSILLSVPLLMGATETVDDEVAEVDIETSVNYDSFVTVPEYIIIGGPDQERSTEEEDVRASNVVSILNLHEEFELDLRGSVEFDYSEDIEDKKLFKFKKSTLVDSAFYNESLDIDVSSLIPVDGSFNNVEGAYRNSILIGQLTVKFSLDDTSNFFHSREQNFERVIDVYVQASNEGLELSSPDYEDHERLSLKPDTSFSVESVVRELYEDDNVSLEDVVVGVYYTEDVISSSSESQIALNDFEDRESVTFDFSVSENASGSANITFYVYGTSSDGEVVGDSFSLHVNVLRVERDVVSSIDSVLLKDGLTCGDSDALTGYVYNRGLSDEDFVTLDVSIPGLNYSESFEFSDLASGEKVSFSFELMISEDVAPGYYGVILETSTDDGVVSKSNVNLPVFCPSYKEGKGSLDSLTWIVIGLGYALIVAGFIFLYINYRK